MPNQKDLEQRVAELEGELAVLRDRRYRHRSVRKNASWGLGDIPFYSIALGPDPAKGEMRGHAKGVIAIGDVATGLIAIGGWARGVLAIGGLATGLFAAGGLSLGLLVGIGGLGIGGLAVGGGALGGVAIGGGAAGYYACGGGAAGTHVISPAGRDPEAVEFFERWGLQGACTAQQPRRMR